MTPVPAGAERGPCAFASRRHLLLEMLSESGWSITVEPAPRLGVKVTARGYDHVVSVEGSSVAAVATYLFETAVHISRGVRP